MVLFMGLVLLFAGACDDDPATVPTPSATPSIAPAPTPELMVMPTTASTETLTPMPTATPQPTSNPEATATPTPVPTAIPTALPTETPTPVPTTAPTALPTETPTPVPTVTQRPVPTATPTPAPDADTALDRSIPALLEEWGVPGAAIAIVKDGRLVLAQGYGFANVETEMPVEPGSLFRVASIAKPITAVAVMRLVEDGLLELDDRAFQILDETQPSEATARDPRLNEITVRHLLQHSGGWDSSNGYDPMWIPGVVEEELGVSKPVTCRDVIRFMLSQQLDFDPGTQYAYSNFGYCLLGRIIEKKTGQAYEEYVRQSVLKPLGITRMRIGATLLQDRVDGEVVYYGYPEQELAHSVLPNTPDLVPWPYGGFRLRTMDAHGGWIASAVDLVRFASSFGANGPSSVIGPEMVQMMVARPEPPLWEGSSHHYGMGWLVRPAGEGANWWHNGSLPGTYSLLVKTHHDFAWAALFNSRPREWARFSGEVDRLMWQGVQEVSHWPSHDLFPEFGIGSAPTTTVSSALQPPLAALGLDPFHD